MIPPYTPSENRDMLADLIESTKAGILELWRERVRLSDSAKSLTDSALNDEIPKLLDEIVVELRTHGVPKPGEDQIGLRSEAVDHGEERFKAGFSVVEVVREYSILREVITESVEASELGLTGLGGQTINRAINSAISIAIESFSLEKAKELRLRREEYFTFVVHDLKTPLNAISLAAKLVQEDIIVNPQAAEEMLQLLLRNVARMEGLLQKIIETEKALKAGESRLVRREIDLWPLVQGILEDVRGLAKDSSTSVLCLIPTNTIVFADAVALKSVFLNLISNALKYTTGGEVVIGVRTIAGGEIECWVRDNGAGMTPERQAKLFIKAEADPEKKGSTGLGLLIVRKEVEAHGGTLTIESKLGQGSTFRFTLPATPADALKAYDHQHSN